MNRRGQGLDGYMDLRIDRILAPYVQYGDRHYGESVTQYAHAAQCACLAQQQGEAPAMVVAALLHDIGHLLDVAGNAADPNSEDVRHEDIGTAFLDPYFGLAVTEPIRLHVRAKRYLCTVEPGYRAGLSAASEVSLRLQGGPLSLDEADAFEQEPYFAEAIELRRLDEAAKRVGWAVPPLESYRALLAGLLLPE